VKIIQGDCVEAMREMDEASVDAIVTDPPYFLGFMGKAWDTATPGDLQHGHDRWATEALRVLKSGGHLLAFGGTRTYHRLACAIEDAGFEIRDSVIWLYGSGFPKSLDVSKAIDRAAGAEREVGEPKRTPDGKPWIDRRPNGIPSQFDEFRKTKEQAQAQCFESIPATPEAQQWQGWGTALKPAHEPIVVARKPLIGTVAQNVLEHGTGALNVDGCRIGSDTERGNRYGGKAPRGSGGPVSIPGPREEVWNVPAGRWPANVALSHLPECERVGTRHGDPDGTEQVEAWRCAEGCPVAELDRQSGSVGGGDGKDWSAGPIHGTGSGATFLGEKATGQHYGDTGGASRFFYVAKASRAERNAGMKNTHPTVKPIDLMRWLVRLVTPPNGVILDPFAGSGTTGCAATLEGFDFIGIERGAEYVEIARARIEWWSKQDGETKQILKQSKKKPKKTSGETLF
jgi:DNA modification methylase